MLTYLITIALIIPVVPILFFQGTIMQKKLKRLPEAEGTYGVSGDPSKSSKKVLIIGESSMVGIGIKNHQLGFAGSLATELANKLDLSIIWKVYAKRGYTVKQINEEIFPQIKEDYFDLIIIGVGANDCFALRSPGKWRNHIENLLLNLKFRFKNAQIVFLNMPPIHEFPAFSKLMKLVFGRFSVILGSELEKLIKAKEYIYFNSEKIKLEDMLTENKIPYTKSDLYVDGVHPSELTCQLWAKDLADFITSTKII